MQSGSSSMTEIEQIEEHKRQLQSSLDSHKEKAQDSHECHTEAVKRCKDNWRRIVELEKQPDADTNEELKYLKESYVLVVCADYQQSKLIPYYL